MKNTKTKTLYIDRIIICSLLLTLLSFKGISQNNYHKIDTTIAAKLEKIRITNELISDSMSDFEKESEGYFLILESNDDDDYDPIFEHLKTNKDKKKFLDTTSLLFNSACGCALQNDTMFIVGGVFWEGNGAGFLIKVTKQDYNGSPLFGDNKKYKQNKNDIFREDIILKNKSQKLIFTKKPVFKLEESIQGEFIMESDVFYEKTKSGLKENKVFMRVVFNCKLDEATGF